MTSEPPIPKITHDYSRKRAIIESLLVAGTADRDIVRTLSIDLTAYRRISNKVREKLKVQGVDESAPGVVNRKLLNYFIIHDVIGSALLVELYKTKAAIDRLPDAYEASGSADGRVKTVSKELYDRLAMLTKQLTENNKTFSVITDKIPMGVPPTAGGEKSKGPPHVRGFSEIESVGSGDLLLDLELSAKRQLKFAQRRRREAVAAEGDVSRETTGEVVDTEGDSDE